jgi:hypothetical protein
VQNEPKKNNVLLTSKISNKLIWTILFCFLSLYVCCVCVCVCVCVWNIVSHSAVVYKGCMYVMGGFGDTFYNDLWRFNFKTKVWTQIKTNGTIPPPRHFHSASVYKDSTSLHLLIFRLRNIQLTILVRSAHTRPKHILTSHILSSSLYSKNIYMVDWTQKCISVEGLRQIPQHQIYMNLILVIKLLHLNKIRTLHSSASFWYEFFFWWK